MHARGVVGQLIDPSWLIHCVILHSSQHATTGITKAMVCVNNNIIVGA